MLEGCLGGIFGPGDRIQMPPGAWDLLLGLLHFTVYKALPPPHMGGFILPILYIGKLRL